jgi:GTP-binding protein Era
MNARAHDDMHSADPVRAGTVALVGRPNVGKSTLLNAALEQPLAIVSSTPQTTRDAILGIVRYGSAEIAILDTPGLHHARNELGRVMNRRARDAAREADVVVFVTDVPEAKNGTPKGVEPPPITPHRGDIALLRDIGQDQRTILVVNKIDRIRRKTDLFPLLEGLGKLRNFEAVVPISARKTDGVQRVLDEIVKLLPEGAPRYGEDDMTDRPVKFFAAEYVREQILRATAEEVPHSVAVVIDRFHEPASSEACFIDATIHVERPGQKKILVGTGASMLKHIGTNARIRIEELIGRKVMLKLWVSVTPDWRESRQHLDDLGYGKHVAGAVAPPPDEGGAPDEHDGNEGSK